MSRELIVSVNGREKKIAIVENERVTEFYIERGEQNQGIVGNIYKGRVMRVLPGMQSAFVDIGLERDAFLYVTDFFDEEAEFERIVVDKSKKVDPETATRTATEHFERISDDEERAMNGEMFKDARLQERLLDEVHAAEFDMEDLPSAPVGSLLSDPSLIDSGSFQRIADDDDSTAAPLARAQELEAARVRNFVDEIADESSRSLSFERVSDDEASEGAATAVGAPTVEPGVTDPAMFE